MHIDTPFPFAAVAHARRTLKRIEEGLALVGSDATAFEAFRFMNRSMWLQRTRSLYSEQIRQGKDVHYDDVDEADGRRAAQARSRSRLRGRFRARSSRWSKRDSSDSIYRNGGSKSLLRVTPVRWGPVATGGFPPRLA